MLSQEAACPVLNRKNVQGMETHTQKQTFITEPFHIVSSERL